MARFKRGDRVVLLRGVTGVPMGTLGTVIRQDIGGNSHPETYLVQWDTVTHGDRTKLHRVGNLDDAPPSKVATQAHDDSPSLEGLSGVDKRFALLELDDQPATLDNLFGFVDSLKEIAEITSRLRKLHKTVKQVPLYRGPDCNLYLTIKDKDVYLIKSKDGNILEMMALPLSVVVKLVESYKQGAGT